MTTVKSCYLPVSSAAHYINCEDNSIIFYLVLDILDESVAMAPAQGAENYC